MAHDWRGNETCASALCCVFRQASPSASFVSSFTCLENLTVINCSFVLLCFQERFSKTPKWEK